MMDIIKLIIEIIGFCLAVGGITIFLIVVKNVIIEIIKDIQDRE